MKLIKIILIFFISLNISLQVNSNDYLIKSLKESNKFIFIRHSIAPGFGDPKNFDIFDCSSQRNLSFKGINQSKAMGLFFSLNNIKIEKVISSEWCRCKETAFIAFKKFTTKSFLNSFYDKKFTKNKDKQIKELKKYIKNSTSEGNIVFVTHYVVISELLNVFPESGKAIITDKNLYIIDRIIF